MCWRLKKISCKPYLVFCFLVTQSNFQKLSWPTCTFIPLLLNSCDLPSCNSEMRKRYTLRLLLICLETLGEKFPYFSWRDCERGNRKLLSLAKLYRWIWIRYLYQYLIMALLIVAVCINTILRKEEPTRRTICNFSFKMFKKRFSRFWKSLLSTWNSLKQHIELTQKYVLETKTLFS